MKKLLLVALLPLGLPGCISYTQSSAPRPGTTIVVPPGSTVICPDGFAPPC
ncbi:hypothetical protein [Rhodopila sp.]|uniref:hypothetical protein n=1 Tax=Rhodopila sp. TaxID=2480087 RepID=UPI003D12E26E